MAPGIPALLQTGVRYQFWHPAGTCLIPGKGEFPEVFASGAFDRTIGTIVPLKMGDPPGPGVPDSRPVLGHIRVIAADVAPDGSGVSFTYEITDLKP